MEDVVKVEGKPPPAVLIQEHQQDQCHREEGGEEAGERMCQQSSARQQPHRLFPNAPSPPQPQHHHPDHRLYREQQERAEVWADDCDNGAVGKDEASSFADSTASTTSWAALPSVGGDHGHAVSDVADDEDAGVQQHQQFQQQTQCDVVGPAIHRGSSQRKLERQPWRAQDQYEGRLQQGHCRQRRRRRPSELSVLSSSPGSSPPLLPHEHQREQQQQHEAQQQPCMSALLVPDLFAPLPFPTSNESVLSTNTTEAARSSLLHPIGSNTNNNNNRGISSSEALAGPPPTHHHQQQQHNHHPDCTTYIRSQQQQQQQQRLQQQQRPMPQHQQSPPSTLSGKQQWLIFIKFLFQYLKNREQRQQQKSIHRAAADDGSDLSATTATTSTTTTITSGEILRHQAKAIITECTRRNRLGDKDYFPLQQVIDNRLRDHLGETHWNRARSYFAYFCHRKGIRIVSNSTARTRSVEAV